MAVKEEYPYSDEKGFADFDKVKHYSDSGKTLIQVETGKEYEEALDVYPCQFSYVEKEDEVPEMETENGEGAYAHNAEMLS